MSANTTTAMHGQSSHVGLLGAAAVLTAVVAAGAVGVIIGTGVRPITVDAPVAGPVIDSTSMSGPRTGAQKGLGSDQAAIAATKDADASIVLPAAAAYSGTAFAAQYEQWVKAQSTAAGSDFPDLYQRLVAAKGAAYGGSDFAGQFEQWAKGQAVAASADFPDLYQRLAAQAAASSSTFPDYFERLVVNTGTLGLEGYGGSDFAGQYEQWLKAQAAASGSDFPDWFQRHTAPESGTGGGRGLRLPQ